MTKNFHRKILKNGMTIILEKRNLPVVSVAFAVRSGGINESEEEKGISHFIEHLLYKGTPTRDYTKIYEEIERNGGELNGFTSEEITAFYCKMPSRHLNIALDVLSDMMKNPLFDEKELEKERKVIFEEMKMRRDSPTIYVFDKIHEFLYEKPVSIGIIGTEKTMNSIDRKKIFEKFKKVYTPENMILIVVGDADFSHLVKFAEKTFGKEKGSVKNFKVVEKDETKIEFRKGIDQANLILAYHTPLAGDKKSYSAIVLNTLLAEGGSSRLFNEIREKRNLAYSVKGDSNISKSFSYNMIFVGTTKKNLELVKKLILDEFENVGNHLGEKELVQVKEQIIGNYQISMEDSQRQMMNLLSNEISGSAEEFYDFEKNISSVKLKDVKELAKTATEKYSFFALVPE